MGRAGRRTLIRRFVGRVPYRVLDDAYLASDRRLIRRTRNISRIPFDEHRRGGKRSYAEWAHVIGIFQALICLHLERNEAPSILDIGCGTGLLGIASEPSLGERGRYVGLDVSRRDISFCRSHYPQPPFEFIHFDARNPAYAPGQAAQQKPWPVADESFDLVTALSVWTHLDERDASYYMREVARVLKPGAKAIITFFVLDEMYERSLAGRSEAPGRYHPTPQDRWIFDAPTYGSVDWFCPGWAKVPEQAIGVTSAGVDRMIVSAGLRLVEVHHGNWKEIPGLYFQDVLILEKASQ